jgi:hypothetical protein
MNRLLQLSVLVLILWPAVHGADALEIPADYRAHVNRNGFIATLARNCDIELEVYGYSHVSEASCQNFLSQLPSLVIPEAQVKVWGAMEKTIMGPTNLETTDYGLRFQLLTLLEQRHRALQQMEKTMQHLKFLVDVKNSSMKKSTKNGKGR